MSESNEEQLQPPLGDRRARRSAEEVSSPGFWESLYRTENTPWDLGRAAPPLVRAAAQATNGGGAATSEAPRLMSGARAVVLGCGRGHDALELARLGLEVTGYDFSIEAVVAAREAAARAGLPVTFEQRDIFDLPADTRERFDLAVEHTCYCAIHPERRGDYVRVVESLLVPGGLFLALFFPIDPARPGGPPYGVTEEDVRTRFTPRFDILSLDDPADSHESRVGRERLAWMRRAPPPESSDVP